MLIITQGVVNPIVTTLTEKKQSNTTIYLFEAVNQESNNKIYCVASDVSTSPNRYNEFCISESPSGGTNPYNSQIILALTGFYYYNIYENPNSVLSPTGLNQVETGKLLVLPLTTTPIPKYISSVNPSKFVYARKS